MLTRIQQGAIIPATLTLTGQGESLTFNVNYRNMKRSELNALLADNVGKPNVVFLQMVESWEAAFPLTEEGLVDLEDERPGSIMGIIEGFHEARKMAKEKN